MRCAGVIPENSTALHSHVVPASPPPLATNATWRLAATLVRAFVGLVGVPLFTRALGISQWGLLALFQTAAAPLVLLDLGLGAAVVKYVSESLARGDRERAVRVAQTVWITNLVLGIAGATALMLAAHWLATSLFAIPAADAAYAQTGFRIAAITWFLGFQTSMLGAVIAAHQRYDVTSKLNTLSMALSTATGVAAAFAYRDVVAVMWAQCAIALGMTIVQFRVTARSLFDPGGRPRWDRGTFVHVFRFGIWQMAAMVGSMLSGWSDRYILGAWFAPAVIGFYAAAQVLYTQLYGAFSEVSEVLVPAVSHRQGAGDLPGARRLTLIVGWALTNGFGVCAIVLAVVGGDFLHLWVSPETAGAVTFTLRLLCGGGIIGIAALAPFHYVLGIGEARWNAASSMLIGIVVLGAGLWLVPRFGLLGVGYGLVIGVVARWGFVAAIWRVYFARDLRLAQFSAHVWAPALTSLLLLVALTRLHDGIGHAATWPWLLFETPAVLATAAVLQLAASEALPGGAERRSQVVASFRLMVTRGYRSRTSV